MVFDPSPTPQLGPEREMLDWHRSPFANGPGAVEYALCGDGVAVRHADHPDDVAMVFPAGQWQAFVDACRLGYCDVATIGERSVP